MTPEQRWSAELYQTNAGFVPALGAPLIEWLQPQPGERVLDLGCGDGTLSLEILKRGVSLVGVDAAPSMVAAAREQGIDAREGSGEALTFDRDFDAVFSNAALHWMRQPAAVASGVARALRPGGRFVGELGGQGNVASIVTAIRAVLQARGVDPAPLNPWYFPTATAYRQVLEAAGFEVERLELIPRPTVLPTGMTAWLETFAQPFLQALPEAAHQEFCRDVSDLLAPSLLDGEGVWTADYVRLRFAAKRVN